MGNAVVGSLERGSKWRWGCSLPCEIRTCVIGKWCGWQFGKEK